MLNFNTYYLGDCFDLMNQIDDNSIDMIFCDLPYNTTNLKWDKQPINLVELWKHYNRIIKPNSAIVLTACQPFTSILVNSNLKGFKYDWVWDKHFPRNFINAKIMPMAKHESVLVFSKNGKKIRYYPQMTLRDKPIKRRNCSKKGKASVYKIQEDGVKDEVYTYTHTNPNTIITGCWEKNSGKIHPTQKPASLIEYLLKTYTQEGDIVLDNCAGSASTGIAAIRQNRRYILIEKDAEYYNLGQGRLNVEKRHKVIEKLKDVIKADYIESWLETPNTAFNGQKPVDMINSGQEQQIFNMIEILNSGS